MAQDPRLFGETAVKHGFLTSEQLEQTLDYQRRHEPARSLGELLVERGVLSSSQAAAIEKLRVVLETAGVGPPDENDLVGKTLQRCLILEPIGSGGMGSTYRAHHLRLDRDVAIKVLHPRLVKVPGNLQRFEREARAAAKLEHPGIVQVYDFDEERGFHFIVMQFAEGQNLREVLYRKGPLGTRRSVWVAQRVLEALEHAHSVGIVHRDIKPANLIITKEPKVKVTDFGLVRVLSATTSERLSAYGEILGTPQYMSPEQACSGEVDARADLYSLGITLFELMTGRAPFSGASTIEVLQKQICDPLPKLRESDRGVPAEVEAFVEKLCEKDPAKRHASAAEALEALRAIRLEERAVAGASERQTRALDPSRVFPAPPLVTEDSLKDLKKRLKKSSEMRLVAFEPEAPQLLVESPAPREPEGEAAVAGDPARAIREAAAAGKADQVVPEILSALWKEGRDAEIVGLARELASACPTLPAAEFYLGLAYERRSDWETARAKLSLAIAFAPDHLPARFHLAKVLTELGKLDEATQVLEQGVLLAPRSANAAARLAEFLYLVKKDAAAAVKAYERAVELAPNRWQLRQQLGWILYELGRLEESEAVLREVLEWTQDAAPRELYARVADAVAKLREAPRTEPAVRGETPAPGSSPRISATLDLIQLAVASGRWDRVVEVATRGLAEQPRAVPLLLARARGQLELGQYSEAVNDYALALALSPTNPEANEGLLRAQEARKGTRRR